MQSFQFKTKQDQVILLGLKAKNLGELLDGIKKIPDTSIFYHTHRFLEQHRTTSPEPPNDFAYWVTNVVNNEWLGEQLVSVQIMEYRSLLLIRNKYASILESYSSRYGDTAHCPPGEEFHFMACQTFVLPTKHIATTPREFKEILLHITINSVRYHVFDRILQSGCSENDFSAWFRVIGHADLADRIARVDPYAQTIEGLRNRILSIMDQYEND